MKTNEARCDHKFINSNYCLKCGFTPAHEGHHFCYVLTKDGWRNQGMVPDDNRIPFVDDYIKSRGTQVAFVPFCWHRNPNVMTDAEIRKFAVMTAAKEADEAFSLIVEGLKARGVEIVTI